MKKEKINLEAKYILSKSLSFEITDNGEFVVRGSISRIPQNLSADFITVLLKFSNGEFINKIYEDLKDVYYISKDNFYETIKGFIVQGFIVPSNTKIIKNKKLAKGGFANINSHQNMLNDNIRTLTYKYAIEKYCKGKTVVDVGCGTGVLSLFAAKAGAKKVHAIEESEIAKLSKKMFAKNNCNNIIDLHIGNSKDIKIPEKSDILIHEIFGIDPLGENILPFIDDAKNRFLKPKGKLLPERFSIYCCGVNNNKEQGQVQKVKGYENLYNLDFSAYLEELKKTHKTNRYYLQNEYTILTKEIKLFDFNLYNDNNKLPSAKNIRFKVIHPGKMNQVLIYFKAYFDDQIVLLNSPFTNNTHWKQKGQKIKSLDVNIGDVFKGKAIITLENGFQSVNVEINKK